MSRCIFCGARVSRERMDGYLRMKDRYEDLRLALEKSNAAWSRDWHRLLVEIAKAVGDQEDLMIAEDEPSQFDPWLLLRQEYRRRYPKAKIEAEP